MQRVLELRGMDKDVQNRKRWIECKLKPFEPFQCFFQLSILNLVDANDDVCCAESNGKLIEFIYRSGKKKGIEYNTYKVMPTRIS